MEKAPSSIDKIQALGVIESVIAEKLVGRPAVNSKQVIREFERHSKRLNPDERRRVLNEGFTEAVAAQLEASQLPSGHPKKEYAELRAQTISEFMGWLGNKSGDVANVKAGKNADGTYQRIAPIDYKASLAVDGYKQAMANGETELAEAIKQTSTYSFAQPFEVLINDGVTSAVGADEVALTLDKAKSSVDKTKGRAVQVLAATALSVVAVASSATPSAASQKTPEVADIDRGEAHIRYVTNEAHKQDVLAARVQVAEAANDKVAIKEVALSEVPAPKVKASPKEVDVAELATGADAASALLKSSIDTSLTFTPEVVKATLPTVEKTPVAAPRIPKEIREAFTPEAVKADLQPVTPTPPKPARLPKQITDTLVPEIVKIDSGLHEEAPKVTIVAPKPEAPATAPAPKAEAPAPTAPHEQGPYELNAEQNSLIDGLSLSPSQKAFLKQVTAGAIGLQQRGAKVNPEVVIAQSILESGWGGSELTKLANNYFGMKAGTDWKGKTVVMPTQEFINGAWVTVDANWQAFASAEDCFAEYEKFIKERAHFADALEHTNDPEAYVNALVNGNLKYATDPAYVQKIMSTVKANNLSKIVEIAHTVQADKEAAAKAAGAKKAAEAKAAAEATPNAATASHKETQVEEFTGWHHPVPVKSRESPQYPRHKGLDYAVPAGTPFYAAVGGVVKVLEYNVKDEQFCKDAFNNIGASMDIIKDPIQKEVRITRTIGNDTYEVIYAHMSQIDVKDGQIVKGNEQIGKTGNSGCSTGDHAHFEIRVNGVSINPNVLFIHGKIQPMGAIKSSSTDKREGQAKSTQDHATEEEHLYVHSSAESDAKHAKVVESDEQLPDRRKKIDAIKRLAALKSQMSQSHESQQLPVEGYLSVR